MRKPISHRLASGVGVAPLFDFAILRTPAGRFLPDVDKLRRTRPWSAKVVLPTNRKSLPATSNSSKRGLAILGMFTPSGRPLRSCTQPGNPAPESDK
jgi:hypothetical protein